MKVWLVRLWCVDVVFVVLQIVGELSKLNLV